MLTLAPDDGLLAVDVQNDFLPGGSLAVRDGDQVVPVLNCLIPRFPLVILSRDWHPADHLSFADPPTFTDRGWPSHCVRNTPGADFAPSLALPPLAVLVSKGTDPGREAYSAFDGTGLAGLLRRAGVKRLFIGGLATDYCVRASALDALREGFAVVVVTDACRGVDAPPGTADAALRELAAAGAVLARSTEVG